MSFFYLQRYEPNAQSLLFLKDILDVSKPKYVALQLSQEEFDREYLPVLRHPSFLEALKKVEYLMETKNEEALASNQELDITKGIENLYISNYCRLNGCKVYP